MKLQRCKIIGEAHVIYFLPLMGFSWDQGKKAFWVGWLKWVFVIYGKSGCPFPQSEMA